MINLFFSATQKTNTANGLSGSEQFNAKSFTNADGVSFKEMLTKQANMAADKAPAERKSQEKISQPQTKQVEPDNEAEQNQQKSVTDTQPAKAQPMAYKKLATVAKQAEVKSSTQANLKTTSESGVKSDEQVTDTANLSTENLFAILEKAKKGVEKLKDTDLKEASAIDATLGAAEKNKVADMSLLNLGLNLPTVTVDLAQSVSPNITPDTAKSGLMNAAEINKDMSQEALSDALASASTDKFKRDLTQKGGRDVNADKADFGQSASISESKLAKQLDSKSQMISTLMNDANQASKQDKLESQFSNSLMMLSQPLDTQNMTQLAANVPLTPSGNANQIGIPLGKSGWDQAVSQRIMLMVGSSEQTATLTLNPPDLGPLQVVVHVHNGQADTTFITDHTHVRNAIENSLGTLQNMMQQAGVNMGSTEFSNTQSHLSQQQNQQNGNQSRQAGSSGSNGLDNSNQSSTIAARASTVSVRQGLVDTFA